MSSFFLSPKTVQDAYPGYGGVKLEANSLIVFPSLLPHRGFAGKERRLFQFNVYMKKDIRPYAKLEKDHTLTPTSLLARLTGDVFDFSGKKFNVKNFDFFFINSLQRDVCFLFFIC